MIVVCPASSQYVSTALIRRLVLCAKIMYHLDSKNINSFKMVIWDSFSACRGAELAFLQEKGKYSVIILPTSTEIAAFAGSLKPAQAEGSQPTITTFPCVQG